MNKKQLKITTFALLLANFMGGLDGTIINTALSSIVRDLQGIQQIGLLTSIFLFCLSISTVFWGKLGEIFGDKKIFQIAMSLFMVSSLFEGLSQNMTWLIIGRGVMGIATGGMVSLPFIIYARIYKDNSERAKALGWVSTFYAVATIGGPIIGGWIVDVLNWRWIFYINIPIALLSIILIQISYHEEKVKSDNISFDFRGAILLIAFLSSLLFIIENLNKFNYIYMVTLSLLTIALFVLLWNIEKRAKNPIIPNELLIFVPYMSKNIMMFLVYGLFMGYSIYAPMWAQNILGTSATMAGATQILSSIFLIISTRCVANLFNRFSFQKIVMSGFLSIIISAILISSANINSPYWILIISGGFQGLGMGLVFTPLQVAVQNIVDKQLLGVATTLSLLIRTLGQTFMAAIYGVILNIQLLIGVNKTNGKVTIDMINQLSNLSNMSSSAVELIPLMKSILFSGIHLIMIIGLVLVVCGAILNNFGWKAKE